MSTDHRDHLFILETTDPSQLWFVFCETKGFNKDSAREQIKRVWENEKGINSYSLNYLGIVDFSDMDKEVKKKLYYFEKYDPVWMLKCSNTNS